MLLPSAANTALLVVLDGVLAVVVAAVAVCELNAAEGRSRGLPFMLTLALDDRRSLEALGGGERGGAVRRGTSPPGVPRALDAVGREASSTCRTTVE